MVRDFLIFATSIAMLFFTMFFIGIFALFSDAVNIFEIPIGDNKQYIVNGNFSEFPSERILGKDGYFFVLDKSGNEIYTSNEMKGNPVSIEALKLLPIVDSSLSSDQSTFTGSDGMEYTQLILKETKNGELSKQNTIIVDENLQLIFSTISNMQTSFTPEEFLYLSGNYSEDLSVSRFEYTSDDGKIYTAVFFRSKIQMTYLEEKVQSIFDFFKYSSIALFILAVMLYLVNLDRKVKTPIMLLDNAIQKFMDGSCNKPIEYKGPREFQQICSSFNKMASQLSEAEGERKKAEDEKQKMLSDISHDLKTPITVIQGYAKIITDDRVSEEERKEYLENIYSKSNSLAELIDTFSEYSKLERSDFTIKTEKLNICEYARDYLIDKYNEIEFLGYVIDTDIPEAEVFCLIDHFQMKRVFENILSNSIKYNEKGTKISFRLTLNNGSISINIGDDGVGIPDEIKDSIFNPFSVGDKARGEQQGSGLGMAIVDKIVRGHGGVVKLLTHPKQDLSTEFEIVLPTV